MGSKDEMRIFVGGLSWDTSERRLEDVFSRFGKVLEAQLPSGRKDEITGHWDCNNRWSTGEGLSCSQMVEAKLMLPYQIMVERDTGRPRGFGFVTFADQRGMEAAISEMHGRELDGREISVNKAEPKIGSDGPGYGYGGGSGGGGGYSSGGRGGGGYGSGRPDRGPAPGGSDCFKCGRPGHWARECPSAGGGDGGGRFSSRSRFSGAGGGGGPRGDRFSGSDRYSDRYADDYDGGRYDGGSRYEGGRYGDRDRDRAGSRDGRYGGGRDRYADDRYPPGGADRYGGDKYGSSDRYPQNGYGKDRSYYRDGSASARGGSDRYGGGGSGGPARYEGGAGYRDRPGPYDRPSRGSGRPSYDDRY